ncbi:MAG: methyltransferase [Myxococcales bacterium]|nr:methyltransferase [Myxococcales bacterium]
MTCDTLLRGRVTVFQPARGYRFSLDPVLLAGFLTPPYGDFVDLGAGCGVLGFVLATRDPHARGEAIELQPHLADLLARGAQINGLHERLTCHVGDFLAWAPRQSEGSFDLVACNPPFYRLEGGHLSPKRERALAHHELALPLPAWTAAAARLLAPQGRLGVVFPASRDGELFEALTNAGLAHVRMRYARPSPGRPRHRLFVEARPGPTSREVEPDLVVHEGEAFSPDVSRLLDGAL